MIKNTPLSNMFPCPVTILGQTYQSSESAFQASKLADRRERSVFFDLNGYEAKKLGKEITLRSDWNNVRLEVMELCLRAKVMQNKSVRDFLINTAPNPIHEVNTWGDLFWGCDENLKGKNILGQMLMRIRNEL